MSVAWQPIAFIELALQAVLGLTTLNLAWKCRDIFSEFNETVPTMTITILMALSALVVFSVSSMADLDPHTQYVFQALVLLGTTSFVVIVVPGYKLLPCFRHHDAPISFEEWKQRAGGAMERISAGLRRGSSKYSGDENSSDSVLRSDSVNDASEAAVSAGEPSNAAVRLPAAEVFQPAVTRVLCGDSQMARIPERSGSEESAGEAERCVDSITAEPDANNASRLRVSFVSLHAAYMAATHELKSAVASLVHEEEALTGPKESANDRASFLGQYGERSGSRRGTLGVSKAKSSSFLARRLSAALARRTSALSKPITTRASECASTFSDTLDNMEVSEVPSLLAIKLSLGRTSATVPMEEAGHTLTPAQLLEQPRLLLQLVDARIRQCQGPRNRARQCTRGNEPC